MELPEEVMKNNVPFKMDCRAGTGNARREINIKTKTSVYSGLADYRNVFRTSRIWNHVSGSFKCVVVQSYCNMDAVCIWVDARNGTCLEKTEKLR